MGLSSKYPSGEWGGCTMPSVFGAKRKSWPRPMRYSSLSLKDLVCVCAGPCDDDAWEELASRVGKPIRNTIRHTARRWSEHSRPPVEDLIQVTYLKLWDDSRLLRDFANQHPEAAVLGYIKTTAANVTHDYFKPSMATTGPKVIRFSSKC
jgi:hypothetical protein